MALLAGTDGTKCRHGARMESKNFRAGHASLSKVDLAWLACLSKGHQAGHDSLSKINFAGHASLSKVFLARHACLSKGHLTGHASLSKLDLAGHASLSKLYLARHACLSKGHLAGHANQSKIYLRSHPTSNANLDTTYKSEIWPAQTAAKESAPHKPILDFTALFSRCAARIRSKMLF